MRFEPPVTFFDVVEAFDLRVYVVRRGAEGHRTMIHLASIIPPVAGESFEERSVYAATQGTVRFTLDPGTDRMPDIRSWFNAVAAAVANDVECVVALDADRTITRAIEDRYQVIASAVAPGMSVPALKASFARAEDGTVHMDLSADASSAVGSGQ